MSNVVQTFVSSNSSINSLLEEYHWITSVAGATSVTYSFPSGADTIWANDYDVESLSWSALSNAESQQAIAVFDLFSSVANISFQEVADTANNTGDIRIAHSAAVGADDNGGTVAWAYAPGPEFTVGSGASAQAGDVWLNGNNYSSPTGSDEFHTIMHEIGHAIGLAHPHDGREILAQEFDNAQYTVMSYNAHSDTLLSGNAPTTLMLYDIAAVQYLYGANNQYKVGDDVYRFDTADILTVWDAGGTDTFDFSGLAQGVTVSLVAGEFSSVGFIDAAGKHATNNVAIAFNVVIENAIGSDYSDIIVGNDADNVLTGGLGDDRLIGGLGADVAVFDVAYSEARLAISTDGVEVDSKFGKDFLQGVETIRFSDGVLSLLSGILPNRLADEALVGRVTSLYQAALNREPDNGGLNFWVDSYTEGFDLLTIAQNFVDSSEFKARFSVDSNAKYLDTLYQNVLGRGGDQGGVEFWLNALDSGHSYAEVLLGFSDSLENQNQLAPLLNTINYQADNGLWVFS